MYKLGITIENKTIWANQCCFCSRAIISDSVNCELRQTVKADGSCAAFIKAPNASDRVKTLFTNLPDEYGKGAGGPQEP